MGLETEKVEGVIPREQLIKGRFYRGVGRFCGDLGFWTGNDFRGFQIKFGMYMETGAIYGAHGFDPLVLIEEGER